MLIELSLESPSNTLVLQKAGSNPCLLLTVSELREIDGKLGPEKFKDVSDASYASCCKVLWHLPERQGVYPAGLTLLWAVACLALECVRIELQTWVPRQSAGI